MRPQLPVPSARRTDNGRQRSLFAALVGCALIVAGYLAGVRSAVGGRTDSHSSPSVLFPLALRGENIGLGDHVAGVNVSAARLAACDQLQALGGRGNRETPPCSFMFFSAHLLCHGSFPSTGSWEGSVWTPGDCTISDASGAPVACPLRAAGASAAEPTMRDVVIIGDSQALRYTTALNRSLAALGITCVRVAEEAQSDFYADVQRVESRRDCGGCNAFAMQCNGRAGLFDRTPVSFQMLFLVMEFVLDFDLATPSRIHWDAGSCNHSEPVPCRWAWSTQQFLFEAFFNKRARGYPGEIHVFQNIHDCARRNAADFRRDLRWLLDLVHTAVPAGSNVYFWEATGINSAKQPADWARVTSNDCVRMMNRAIADEVLPYVAASASSISDIKSADNGASSGGPTWHGTYALHEASLQRLDLNRDGVHFQGAPALVFS